MSEMVYRRLHMLQNKLTAQLQHVAGLNPKGYRMVVSQARKGAKARRNVLDGDFLLKFHQLGIVEQRELARRIGTKPEQIMKDILDITRATAVI